MTSLIFSTLSLGLLLMFKGLLVLWKKGKLLSWKKQLLYSRPLGIALWAVAVGWTLWEVTKLGPSDFGNFKEALFVLFAALGVASVWMLKDYLIVRAGCVLVLYASWWGLQAAYLQAPVTRLVFVAAVYAAIVMALWLAVAPWRARDILEAVQKNARLRRWVGGGYVALGAVLVVVGATYPWVR